MNRIARRLLTLARLPRAARSAAIALGLAVVVAAPAAAAQPTRERFDESGQTNVYGPDRSGCGFAVSVTYPHGGSFVQSTMSDGTMVYEEHADRLITNPANGKTYLQKAAWRDVERLDPASGIITGVTSGRQAVSFRPGDAGPFGVVAAPGLGGEIIGMQWYTYDPRTGQALTFTIKGTFTDICALIA
jgi:hypothetical protein